MNGPRREGGWSDYFTDLETTEPAPPAEASAARPDDEDDDPVTDPDLRPIGSAPTKPAIPEDELPTELGISAVEPPPFTEEQLLSTLESAAVTAPSAFDSGDSQEGWREYRELIATAVVGAAVLVGVFLWGARAPQAPDGAPQRPTPPPRSSPEVRVPPTPPPSRARPEPPPPRPADLQTAPAAIPMLSVVTKPPGAIVKIDGVVYGRAPLILNAPSGRAEFEVELRLDQHRPWTGRLTRDEAGHFTANIELEPLP